MQRLAEQRTVDSRPFPALDRSIRRDRRIRAGAVAVALAVVLATGTVIGTGTFSDPGVVVPAGVEELPQTPEDAGYPAKTVGSLSADQDWLAGLRKKVAKASDHGIASADDVRVVAAGDIEDKARYAVVLYPSAEYAWSREILTGPYQAEPTAMQSDGSESSEDSVPASATAVFSVAGDRIHDTANMQDPTVLIAAPGARSVSVLTSNRLAADGEYDEEWRGLGSPVADGIWATSVSPQEHLLSTVKADGKLTDVSSGNSFADQLGNEPDLFSVASEGSDPERLRDLKNSIAVFGPKPVSPDDEPVYAATAELGEFKVAASLLRSPNGAYITGFSTSDPDGFKAGTLPAGPAPAEVMAGVRATGQNKTYAVVLAPESASKVEVAGAGAPVYNRIAVVEVSAPRDATLDVKALDEHGGEVGRITLPTAMP
ncbi:hypothetical protein GCM10027456_60250 [Kineosporia babensis]